MSCSVAAARKKRPGNFNSLWPSEVIWWQVSRSSLAQVMACWLMARSHYLNQCWLLISEVLWHSPDSNFTESLKFTNLRLVKSSSGQWAKSKHSLKFTNLRLVKSSSGQWVKSKHHMNLFALPSQFAKSILNVTFKVTFFFSFKMSIFVNLMLHFCVTPTVSDLSVCEFPWDPERNQGFMIINLYQMYNKLWYLNSVLVQWFFFRKELQQCVEGASIRLVRRSQHSETGKYNSLAPERCRSLFKSVFSAVTKQL